MNRHDPDEWEENRHIRRLTEEERDILRLFHEGLSRSEIAESLNLSVKEVERHTASLFLKMDGPRKKPDG